MVCAIFRLQMSHWAKRSHLNSHRIESGKWRKRARIHRVKLRRDQMFILLCVRLFAFFSGGTSDFAAEIRWSVRPFYDFFFYFQPHDEFQMTCGDARKKNRNRNWETKKKIWCKWKELRKTENFYRVEIWMVDPLPQPTAMLPANVSNRCFNLMCWRERKSGREGREERESERGREGQRERERKRERGEREPERTCELMSMLPSGVPPQRN